MLTCAVKLPIKYTYVIRLKMTQCCPPRQLETQSRKDGTLEAPRSTCGPYLHDERRARGDIGLLGLQLAVGVVEAIPGGAGHVDHVGVDRREVGEAPRGDAQHAQVVVQRRGAVFDLDALLSVIHGAGRLRQTVRPVRVALDGPVSV